MAIVSLITLLGALAVALLLILQPGSATTVAPRIGLAPGVGVGLGDARPLPSGEALAVSPGRPAGAGGTAALVSTTAAAGPSRPFAIGLGPARAVSRTEPGPGAEPPAEAPPPVAEPEAAAPAPEPVTTPVAAPAPEPVPVAAPKGPELASGSPEPSAAGAGAPEEGEAEPPALEEEPEEEESGEEVEEEATGGGEEEGECTPPFPLAYEGGEHEVALCFEAVGGEARLYLLLDGALIDIDVPCAHCQCRPHGRRQCPTEAVGSRDDGELTPSLRVDPEV